MITTEFKRIAAQCIKHNGYILLGGSLRVIVKLDTEKMGGYRGYDKIAKTGFHNNFSKETWDEYSITIFFSCEVYNQTFSILVSPPMVSSTNLHPLLFA